MALLLPPTDLAFRGSALAVCSCDSYILSRSPSRQRSVPVLSWLDLFRPGSGTQKQESPPQPWRCIQGPCGPLCLAWDITSGPTEWPRNDSSVEGKVGMEFGHVDWGFPGSVKYLAAWGWTVCGTQRGMTALGVAQLSLFQQGTLRSPRILSGNWVFQYFNFTDCWLVLQLFPI